MADNKPMSCESAISVIKRTGLLMSNLALVYYFEYVITTGLPVAIAGQIKQMHPKNEKGFVLTNAFIIFNFCYQIGVFISRSSLSILKIERVWIVTTLQFLNFLFWFSNSFHMYVTSIYVYFVHMVFVGLMGGASFVNVIYQLKNSQKLQKTEKELAMNLLSMFDDLGILSAAITALILTLTAFKQYEK